MAAALLNEAARSVNRSGTNLLEHIQNEFFGEICDEQSSFVCVALRVDILDIRRLFGKQDRDISIAILVVLSCVGRQLR